MVNIQCMKIKAGLKIRKIAGESIVIMQSHGVTDMTKVISLNDTSEWLWNELSGKEFEESDVVDLLTGKFAISREQAETDARAWIESLNKCLIVEPDTEEK